MHINTHTVEEERNKNNTDGKIIMMIDKRERKRRKCAYIFTSLKSQEDQKMMLHQDKKWINSLG